MSSRRLIVIIALILFSAPLVPSQAPLFPSGQDDPFLKKIIELGKTDNQVMTWLDYASNRFGGRYTGSDAYKNAAAWALWQFKQWGCEAELDEAGEVPVGFNRGPWFGRMIKPAEKALYFGTPSMTAGTQGVQRGPVVLASGIVVSDVQKKVAGADIVKKLKKDDAVRSIRIIRVGQAAKEFKTDNATFRKLIGLEK